MSFRPPLPRPQLTTARKPLPGRKPGPVLTAKTAPKPPAKSAKPCK